ncbi:DMT family transporter [Roseovarius sp. SCSIO 43702]|uniref:DMT family transporter n=1 Tax=Roseovarius sp. SCSIO 43702 TaxID=2823043 RepID=UPI001C72F0D2|nr:DMT family transporter [Roseovarius sp. SCSIO 43702]QYX55563.1 DMT family transporter [Roseovarius sp. SCSIO 43702]
MINALTRTGPLWGVFWMLTTGLLFVMVTVLVKILGTRIPAAEGAFLRYVMGLVFFLPMMGPLWRRAREMDRFTLGLFGLRGITHTAGVALWFYGMARIPLADVTAINYLSPIYVTLGAALFLGESLALRRVLAIIAALIGALVILRPGFREVGPGHIAMLGTGLSFGISYLVAKKVSETCGAGIVVAMLSVTVTIGLAPLAIAAWVTPTPWELLILFGVACVATGGHYTMTLAFRAAPLAVTQPVTFLQLVWAVSIGAIFFHEPVDLWVVVGGMIIVASISFISWREAMLKRKATTPAVSATKF